MIEPPAVTSLPGLSVSSFTSTNTTSGNVVLVNTAAPLTVTAITQSGGGSVADGYYGLQFAGVGADYAIIKQIRDMYAAEGKPLPKAMLFRLTIVPPAKRSWSFRFKVPLTVRIAPDSTFIAPVPPAVSVTVAPEAIVNVPPNRLSILFAPRVNMAS